ncbi:potassium channel family protein [Aliisedimentitalea scapharcae]|uniref:Potassium channel family protein n=1 Tax=Aliisedimentitalea scapharcae TaxID=1524259 RepID=A0ABZ2XQ98_9RHOB|nr:potassium channel family protein [Rhodobacteraceae bacterium M382]
MTLLHQLLWGSLYLCICLLIEGTLLLVCISVLQWLGKRLLGIMTIGHNAVLLLTSLAFILLAHSLQVWVWAVAFVFSGALPDWNTAVYFSLISYTALGYGDVVLGPGLRIFGGFSAVTGLLAFGISTAFLVAVLGQALRQTMHIGSGDHEHDHK